MRARKKVSKIRRKVRKLLFLTLLFLIGVVCLFEFSVKRQMTSLITEEMKRITEICVNRAAEDFFSQNPGLSQKLVDVHAASSSVQSIETDAELINRVKTGVSLLSQRYIDEAARDNGVEIMLGSLTGLVLLYDIGPSFHLSVGSKQVVECNLESSFESAGINQTVHHIRLCVHTEVTIYNPFRIRETVMCDTAFEVAQTVIVGSVPSYAGSWLN